MRWYSTTFKVAFTFAAGAFYAARDGSVSRSSLVGSLPAGLTTLRLGSDSTGANQWCGTIKSKMLFNRALADALALSMSA